MRSDARYRDAFRRMGGAAAIACALGGAQAARAEGPLSAIDWLSQSIERNAGLAPGATTTPEDTLAGMPLTRQTGLHSGFAGDEGPTPSGGVVTGTISVVSIDAPTPDAAGLIPAARAGLPRDFWADAPQEGWAPRIAALDPESLPAIQALMKSLLVVEFDAPDGTRAAGALFLARIDKLLEFGALEPALAMLDMVGTDSPALFHRWFDISLLLGAEDGACAALRRHPSLSPSYAARVYCLARGGEWTAAALTLRTAEALDFVTDEEEALLSRFLDPDLHEEGPPLPPLARPTPLNWRILEALGEPMPTYGLPAAFAQADLRTTTGWKAQLDAAERLARLGVLPPNQLLGLYTERRAAASGGVWDRVRSIAALEAALEEGDVADIELRLADSFTRMTQVDLAVPFAEIYAARLAGLPLEGTGAGIAFQVGLLGPDPAAAARAHRPTSGFETFLSQLAQGRPTRATAPGTLGGAIVDAFDAPLPATADTRHDATHAAAVFDAIEAMAAGAAGDPQQLAEGLIGLRRAGLEETARRAALQLLLSDPRG
jgi:hypothetical protein